MKNLLLFIAITLFTLAACAFAGDGLSTGQSSSLPVSQGFGACKTVDASFLGWAIYYEEVLRLNGVDLNKDAEYSKLMRKFQSHLTPTIEKLNLPPRLLAVAENRLDNLYARKLQQYAINVRPAQPQETPEEQAEKPAQPVPKGVVAGIVFSDKPAAIIGSDIVHVGDKIGKITVTKITPDSVEFERGRKHWTRAVGEKANSVW